jgi:hypothetical protein
LENVLNNIKNEKNLEIEKLSLFNLQRLFNELLSRCGNLKYISKVWHAIGIVFKTTENENNSSKIDVLNEA